jgi:Na+/proline symporter
MGLPLSASFHISIIISAIVVLGYILLRGLVSAIYSEVLQFFLIVAGFLPLVLLGLKDVGGWRRHQAATFGSVHPLLAREEQGTHKPDGSGVVSCLCFEWIPFRTLFSSSSSCKRKWGWEIPAYARRGLNWGTVN